MENTKTAAITAEGYSFRCADKEHFEFVEKAIEMRTPKKPIKTDWLYCPNCNFGIAMLRGKKVCPECGQALDWSDTE